MSVFIKVLPYEYWLVEYLFFSDWKLIRDAIFLVYIKENYL